MFLEVRTEGGVLYYINPRHVVSVRAGAQEGCFIHTTDGRVLEVGVGAIRMVRWWEDAMKAMADAERSAG